MLREQTEKRVGIPRRKEFLNQLNRSFEQILCFRVELPDYESFRCAREFRKEHNQVTEFRSFFLIQ